MAAGEYNMTIEQGSDFNLPLEYYDANNVGIPLAGATAKLQARKQKGSSTVLFELSTANGGIVLDDTAHTITLHMDHTATSALNFDSAFYDLEVTYINTKPDRVIEGRVLLSREVTR